jgi:ribosomal protein S17E
MAQSLKRHLARKKPCETTFSNRNREDICNDLFPSCDRSSLKCNECCKSFASRQSLSRHQETQHSVKSSPIHPYGQEDMTGISDEFMKLIVKRRNKGIVDLFSKVFEDKSNQNIRITNIASKFIETFNGQVWLYSIKYNFMHELIDRYYNRLLEHFEKNKNIIKSELSTAMYFTVEKWFEDFDAQEQRSIKDELTITIANATRQASILSQNPR